MLNKEDIRALLHDLESDRIERTVSTTNTDKFGQAICAFANDLPGHHQSGYLILGADDDGRVRGVNVTDELLKNLAGIRTDGNIQPQPSMVVEKVSMEEGDIIVVEVQPAIFPPVRYKGRVWVRVGPRKAIANEDDEHRLLERRAANVKTFDSTPCFGATISDLDLQMFKHYYLPKAVPDEVTEADKRSVEEQLQALGFYDLRFGCPTYAGILFFGKNVERFLGGAYVQYVRFRGKGRAGEILNEHKFAGNLCTILPELDTFIKTTIANRRPIPVSSLREENVVDYPHWATRELLMNAVCHRDYTGNGPVQFYQYDDRIEILNPGGLYGKANAENFPRVNDYRNLVVAEGMKVLGFVNRFSRGVLQVEDALEENGNGLPKFDLTLVSAFLVTEYRSQRGDELERKAIELGLLINEKQTSGTSKSATDDSKSATDNPKSAKGDSKSATDSKKQTSEATKTDINGKKLTSKDIKTDIDDKKQTSGNTKSATLQEFPTSTIRDVIATIRNNPKIKYIQIADNLGITERTVTRAIFWLKANGYINSERSKVKGVWQIIV